MCNTSPPDASLWVGDKPLGLRKAPCRTTRNGRDHMKRTALIAIAAMLFASTAAIAFADDTDAHAEVAETPAPNEAQLRKAELLADYWIGGDAESAVREAAVEELTSLRTGDTVIGWGAMFKLLQLEKATDWTLEELLEARETMGFGRLFRDYDVDRKDGDAPKNLGQLKKQQRDSTEDRGRKSQDD
jgi:hypothetical protein